MLESPAADTAKGAEEAGEAPAAAATPAEEAEGILPPRSGVATLGPVALPFEAFRTPFGRGRANRLLFLGLAAVSIEHRPKAGDSWRLDVFFAASPLDRPSLLYLSLSLVPTTSLERNAVGNRHRHSEERARFLCPLTDYGRTWHLPGPGRRGMRVVESNLRRKPQKPFENRLYDFRSRTHARHNTKIRTHRRGER